MTAEDMIIDYLDRLSRGIVKLNKNQANKIVNMVKTYNSDQIEVQRFDFKIDHYEPAYCKLLPRSEVMDVVNKYKNLIQYKKFYLYRISELQFEYYSVSPNLFT